MTDINKNVERHKGLNRVIFPDDYVVLDLETTGFNPTDDDIMEISILRCHNGDVWRSFSTLVQPDKVPFVSQDVAALTGIDDNMRRTGIRLSTAMNAAMSFIGDSPVVGYGVNFDMNFMYDKWKALTGQDFKNEYIDVMSIVQKLNGRKCKLTELSQSYGIDTTGAHRAINDCFFCNECFKHLQADIQHRGMTLTEFSGFYDPVLKAQQLNLLDTQNKGFVVQNNKVMIQSGLFSGQSFKASFGSHSFDADEISSLIQGDEIAVSGFQTKDGRVIDITGKLGEGTLPNGRQYFGFQRTDIQKRPRPSLPDDKPGDFQDIKLP